MNDDHTTLERRLAAVTRSVGCRLAVVFGSSAESLEKPGRDIDVALEFDQLPGPDRRLEIAGTIEAATSPARADVVFLHAGSSPVLRFEIFRGGRPVFEARPGLFVSGAVRAIALYDDAKPFRDALVRHLQAGVGS